MSRWPTALGGAAIVVALGLHGAGVLGTVAGRSVVGAPEGFAPPADKALVVSVPRPTWEDLERVVEDTCVRSVAPACIWAEGLADAGATNSLRAIGPLTSLPEGYVTLGAGNRATVPATAVRDARQEPDGSWVSLSLPEVVADAEGKLYGAEPGALGQALHDDGKTTAVVASGPDALLALMDAQGRVDGGVLGVPDDSSGAREGVALLDAYDVVLVELAGLDRVASSDPDDPARREAVWTAVEAAYSVIVKASHDTLLVLTTPAPPRDEGQLGVFAMLGATTAPDDTVSRRGPGSVHQSPTTRRAAYVTLTDLAPTLLARLGIDRPDSMNGTPIVATERTSTVEEMASIDRVSRYRDSLVGPISVIYVVLQVLAAFVAMWAIRRRAAAPEQSGPSRASTVAMLMACTVVLVPPVAFATGAFDYSGLSKVLYVSAIFGLSAAAAGGLIAVGRRNRWPVWAPALILIGVALAVQWFDITTGGRLQINTPFGYSPIIAGRFQGFGNLSFSMASAAALVVASAAPLVRPRLAPAAAAIWAATIGGVMVVTDGMPAFGADVGGVLALVPAFVVLATIVSGRRMSIVKLAAAGAAGIAVLVAVAAFDMSRPEEERTHLGRFAARMLDGEAGLIIRRKINANIGILSSSVWTWLVPVIIVFFVVIARRRGGMVARMNREIPGVRAFLGASLVLAVVGFAVNDSGVAIPAAMAGLVLPWVTALALALPPPRPTETAEAAT